MKDLQAYEKDLASIRAMMERSVKFVSLSGLSGVLSGLYALTGSTVVYFILYYPYFPIDFHFHYTDERTIVNQLLMVAAVVLILSLGTGYFLSLRKAKKLNTTIWNTASRQLFIDLFIPLSSGGLLIAILLFHGYYGIVAPASLVFYGLALQQGSRSTYPEVKYLGLTEIVLGLSCAAFPGYGLLFWALGFGVMHIVYGGVMYFRHDR
jgi:hypothetical protein